MGKATAVTIRTDTKGHGRCRAKECQAAIEWYETFTGRRMPVNAGVVYLTTGTDVDGRPLATISSDDVHWATCPAAPNFQR